jgi:small subunit ribosomal protein S16
MPTIIKLQRQGAPHKPFWRIVVTDSRKPGGCVELLGTYDNHHKPVSLRLNEEKAAQWLARGAQPSPSMKRILMEKGLLARTKAVAQP